MPRLKKNQHTPLNVTQKSRHRIFAGLRWDPAEKVTLIERAKSLAGKTKTWHDLDLSCLMFGERTSYIGSVTARTGEQIDETGKIYHSGDNEKGIGDGDDEQISVELRDLDESIHHIVFTVTIKSGHNFDDVKLPAVRLADGYSGHVFLNTALSTPDAANHSGFVFAHVYRTSEGWALHNIESFFEAKDIEKWPSIMASYLHKEIE